MYYSYISLLLIKYLIALIDSMKFLSFILSFIISICSFAQISAVGLAPSSNNDQEAIIDFHAQTFEQGDVIKLNSEWEFYWNELYTYDDFIERVIEPDLIVAPSSWNDLVVDGIPCGSFGFATYRIHMKNLPGKELMLNAYSLQTASKIFINDSIIAEIGTVGKSADESDPWNRDVQLIIPSSYESFDLIIQVSNYHHRKGGFTSPIEIGEPETIMEGQQVFYILDTMESSALIIIGLFLMALFAFRRKDKSILYFSLFCMTLSLRPVIAINYMLGAFLPWLNWSVLIKLEYLGTIVPCLFIILFVRQLFPDQLSKLRLKIFLPLFLLMIAIVIFAPVWIVSWLTYPIMVTISAGIIFLSIAIVKAVNAKVHGAKFAGLGIVILFISLSLKILTYAEVLPSIDLIITVIDIIFIIVMSLILGFRFSRQFMKVEILQEETELQKAEIEEKNKEILDSMKYAKRIQSAILPSAKVVKEYLKASFVLYKPKDIVAGDFYWVENKGNKVLFAAADCTGHGVPGAMVSVVCNNGLNRSVREYGLTDPGEILDKTRELVIQEFEKSEEEVKDGMDIALGSIEGNVLQYAGANNPLWIIRGGEVLETKADKQPIGKFELHKAFTTHTVELQKGDAIYFFSDGYVDQFGGVKGKKFKSKAFKELLLSIQDKSMEDQKLVLDEQFENWRGRLEQIDDVCVIGVKI